jgi:hypothetical protein
MYLEQAKYWTVVIVVYLRPVYATLLQILLILREDVFIEEELKPFIGHVNQELIQTVMYVRLTWIRINEVLEARHIQDTDSVGVPDK